MVDAPKPDEQPNPLFNGLDTRGTLLNPKPAAAAPVLPPDAVEWRRLDEINKQKAASRVQAGNDADAKDLQRITAAAESESIRNPSPGSAPRFSLKTGVGISDPFRPVFGDGTGTTAHGTVTIVDSPPADVRANPSLPAHPAALANSRPAAKPVADDSKTVKEPERESRRRNPFSAIAQSVGHLFAKRKLVDLPPEQLAKLGQTFDKIANPDLSRAHVRHHDVSGKDLIAAMEKNAGIKAAFEKEKFTPVSSESYPVALRPTEVKSTAAQKPKHKDIASNL